MCGIIGFIGKNNNAVDVLINGLKKLEYRGYDSAGLAINVNNKLNIIKTKGRVKDLESKLNNESSTLGIAHTRWATHGEPNSINSHPHSNDDKTIAIVHNGIIENYFELKTELMIKGYKFKSDTDSEVIVHLLDYYQNEDFLKTIKLTVERLIGSYALGIININETDKLYAVRNESPLIIGFGNNANYIASDIPAILNETKEVYYLENKEIARISADNVEIFDYELNRLQKEKTIIDYTMESAEKNGYDHFMLKEIMEQPECIRNILKHYVKNEIPTFDLSVDIRSINRIFVVACGTAYHAGLNVKQLYEETLGIPVEVSFASEFRYCNPLINEYSLVIIISQSGETADSLAALRLAKEQYANVLAIVNVVGSSIAREADDVIYTLCGPEIAVASTKAFTSQLMIIYLLNLALAHDLGKINQDDLIEEIIILRKIPALIELNLKSVDKIKEIASKTSQYNSIYFIGRSYNYSLALEASLKLKEISYIPSEGFAAGELKHGPISLITKNTLVIAISTINELHSKVVSNLKEVISRNAKSFIIAYEKVESDYFYLAPKIKNCYTTIIDIVPLQLYAYYVAKKRKCDIDKPRNLAKSVTVE